jgi:hypothetical protein
MSIKNLEEYDSVQEGAREIAKPFIDDLNDLFLTSVNAKFHSVFLHTGGAFLTVGGFEGSETGIVSTVYTLPKQSTEHILQILSASILNKEIRSGEGFLDVAKKVSQNDNSIVTFTIIPEKNRILYILTTSLDIPIDQIDVYNLKPLDKINLDTVSRSEYFSDGFFPLNSVISVIVYPENDIEVKKVNAPLIGDLADVDMLKQGGWFTYSFQATTDSTQDFASSEQPDFRDRLDMKYFFGTASSVSKQQLEIRSTPIGEELPPAMTGGCLIATAAFGSEMAPQVQFLRELRDNTVLQTESGASFMSGFNQFYYSFSPAIADYERQNPVFKEVVKITLTPLLMSLTLLQYADIDSEPEMLGYGISVILLNIGMYFVAPAVMIMMVRKKICK